MKITISEKTKEKRGNTIPLPIAAIIPIIIKNVSGDASFIARQ